MMSYYNMMTSYYNSYIISLFVAVVSKLIIQYFYYIHHARDRGERYRRDIEERERDY